MKDDILKKIKEITHAEKITLLGKGVYGEAYLIEKEGKKLVLKTMAEGEYGHDHYSDIAQVLLWQNDAFNRFPKHVKSFNVLAVDEEGNEIKEIGKCKKYYILMEYAKGENYFTDLDRILKEGVQEKDKERPIILSDFLAKAHSSKIENKSLYKRKIRDTVGHGECIMGVLDAFPKQEFFTDEEQGKFVQLCVKQWAKMRGMERRLACVHGDFHPGNIMFHGNDFILLDRSRGEYGEPADDLTAFTINYVFYSFLKYGKTKGEFWELNKLFWDNYVEKTKDSEIWKAAPLFYAFRALVVANPLFYTNEWYKERTKFEPTELRGKIIKWAGGLLKKGEFNL